MTTEPRPASPARGGRFVIGDPVVAYRTTARDSVQYTPLPPAASRRVESPVDGLDVWRTVSAYVDGNLLRRRTDDSHHATITGVLLRGKGTAEPAPDRRASP